VFKTHQALFYPYFDQFLPAVNSFLAHEEASARHWALCVFDDVIQFTGPNSVKYQPHFLARMAASLSDSSEDVRQAACYGVGVAALHGGPAYTSFCVGISSNIEALPHLFAIVNAPDSRSSDNLMATENAISAIGKVCKAYKDGNAFNVNQVLAQWFQTLPILEEEEEAAFVYGLLLDLIESNHPAVVSDPLDPAKVAHLVHVITQVLVRDDLLSSDELTKRLVKSLGATLGRCDAGLRTSLWNGLDAETKQYLSSRGYV
jgi:hypothetical protein